MATADETPLTPELIRERSADALRKIAPITSLCSQALRKIDARGPQGVTMVTYSEVEAMAQCLVSQADRIAALEAALAVEKSKVLDLEAAAEAEALRFERFSMGEDV
ncbi:MAG: hypothetical protein AAGF71_04125 [Pseudomonadota bacterium]